LKNIPSLPENAIKCSILPLECPPTLRIKKPLKYIEIYESSEEESEYEDLPVAR
jgi:hypothetical protein